MFGHRYWGARYWGLRYWAPGITPGNRYFGVRYWAPRYWGSGSAATIPPTPGGGGMKVWNGSAWAVKPLKVWNGSAWAVKPLKVWTGLIWRLLTSPPASWPDATTTGTTGALTAVPGAATSGAGWSWDGGSGGITVTGSNVTVANLDVAGWIMITGSNVTLTNCKVTPAVTDSFGISVAVTATSCEINYCEVVGPTGANGVGFSGIAVDDPPGLIISYCDIFGGENGISLSGINCQILHNYIHGLITYAGNEGADPHIDAIQLFDNISNGALLYGNNVISSDDASSCYTGGGQNMTFDNNRFIGGFVCFRFDYHATNTVTNNRLLYGAGGAGFFADNGSIGGSPTFTNNVRDDNDAPLTLAD